MNPPANILTIAGSDSGGGAGIQADLKTITVLGGYGMSIISALTAQNGLGVTGVHAPDADFVDLQCAAVFEGFPLAAAKTGMLFSESIICAVAKRLRGAAFPVVVDPVCISTSGHRLLQQDALDAVISQLIPCATLLTPNRQEAELLAGMPISSAEDIAEASRRILAMGPQAVLLKGGHFGGSDVLCDWYADAQGTNMPLEHEFVDTPHTHGTGCTLSAAIATFLGQGFPLVASIRKAQEYLVQCLQSAYSPGKGIGPVHHAAPIFPR